MTSTTTTTNDIPVEAQETEGIDAIVEGSLTESGVTETLQGLSKGFESKVVVDNGNFFLVICRSSPLSRVISIWKRKAANVSLAKLLRIKFLGESGIDTAQLLRTMGCAEMDSCKFH